MTGFIAVTGSWDRPTSFKIHAADPASGKSFDSAPAAYATTLYYRSLCGQNRLQLSNRFGAVATNPGSFTMIAESVWQAEVCKTCARLVEQVQDFEHFRTNHES